MQSRDETDVPAHMPRGDSSTREPILRGDRADCGLVCNPPLVALMIALMPITHGVLPLRSFLDGTSDVRRPVLHTGPAQVRRPGVGHRDAHSLGHRIAVPGCYTGGGATT